MEKENRKRSPKHLKYVRTRPCMIKRGMEHCNQKAEPHHLLRAQEGAMGMTAGDDWAVPMCRQHHSELHNFDEGEINYFLNWGLEYDFVKDYAQELWAISSDN